MNWPWTTAAEAAHRASERKARFVAVARLAYERTRERLGPQFLARRCWEERPGEAPGRPDGLSRPAGPVLPPGDPRV
ncbi:MAG: hypothetical protein JWR08_984 [Enterovirga sp.]|jgi:hypothetical protein|nr:hypothetical protein [Enterovirga sp.]